MGLQLIRKIPNHTNLISPSLFPSPSTKKSVIWSDGIWRSSPFSSTTTIDTKILECKKVFKLSIRYAYPIHYF